MSIDWQSRLSTALGCPIHFGQSLTGGCVAEVFLIKARDESLVVKVDRQESDSLSIEAKMLRYLKSNTTLPVPEVIHSDSMFLVMEYVQGTTGATGQSEEDAARQLAALHRNTWTHFGFPYPTLIGGLSQPNDCSQKWVPFFKEYRLLYMSKVALKKGHLSPATDKSIERLSEQLASLLDEPAQPSLVHGDVWSGNILSHGHQISGFIDPAIYYADPEIELAFITLFSTFGDLFFDVYREENGIRPGFFELRRKIYNLYPLLVHAALFGGGYGVQVSEEVKSLGF